MVARLFLLNVSMKITKLVLCRVFVCLLMFLHNSSLKAAAVEKTIYLTVGSSVTLSPWNDSNFSGYKCASTACKADDASAFTINVSSTTQTQYQSYSSTYQKGYYSSYSVRALKSGVYIVRGTGTCYKYSFGSTTVGTINVVYHIVVSEKPVVTSISIPEALALKIGDGYTFSPVIVEKGASTTLTWSSSNPNVVSVTSGGSVMANSVGSSIIRCTATNGVSAQCIVTVNPVLAGSVSLNHQELTIEEGCTETLVATVFPANATNKEILWNSSDPAVVLVGTNGQIAGLKAGWAVISATTTDGSNKSATCLVNVTAKPVYIESISLDKESLTMTRGGEAQLSARLTPSNVTNDRLVWKSDDATCVTVDANGTLKALKPGTTVVSATTTDGTNLVASCQVTVNEKEVSSFDNIIYFNASTGVVGNTVTLPLMMNNKDAITAIQFDLALPDGMEVVKNADGSAYDIRFNAQSSRANGSTHSISSALQADNSVRVLCFSVGLDLFSGNSGAVLDIPLSVASDMEAGKYYVTLNNIVLTGKDGEKYSIDSYSAMINVVTVSPGDVNADGDVDVADVVAIAKYILGNRSDMFVEAAADMKADGTIDVADIVVLANSILGKATPSFVKKRTAKSETLESKEANIGVEISPFVMTPGQKSKVLTLDMYNPGTEITAFQLDLTLPEGLEIDLNRRGTAYNLSFNTDADRTDASYHTLSSAKLDNGDVRVLCYSLSLSTFWGEDGAIINIPVTASSDMPAGVYDLIIKNIVLTQTDETKIVPDAYRASIVIGDGGDVRAIKLRGNYSDETIRNFSEAFSSNEAITSIDLGEATIREGVTEELTTANPNTLLYMTEEQSLGNRKNVVVGDQCEMLELTDNMPFCAPKSFMAHEAIYTRNVPGEGWYSLCLPFAPTADPMVKIEKFTGMNELEREVYFEKVDALEPYIPYIFKTNGSSVSFGGNSVEVAATPDEISDGAFVGNLSEMKMPCAAGYYALKPDGSGFALTSETAYASPFRAMIRTNGTAHDVRQLLIIHDGGMTDGVNAVNAVGRPSMIYDIKGMKTTANNKGVYIRDGKKFIKR